MREHVLEYVVVRTQESDLPGQWRAIVVAVPVGNGPRLNGSQVSFGGVFGFRFVAALVVEPWA